MVWYLQIEVMSILYSEIAMKVWLRSTTLADTVCGNSVVHLGDSVSSMHHATRTPETSYRASSSELFIASYTATEQWPIKPGGTRRANTVINDLITSIYHSGPYSKTPVEANQSSLVIHYRPLTGTVCHFYSSVVDLTGTQTRVCNNVVMVSLLICRNHPCYFWILSTTVGCSVFVACDEI